MSNSRELAAYAAERPNVVVLGDFNLRPCSCFLHTGAGGAVDLASKSWERDLRARTGARCSRCEASIDITPPPGGEVVEAVFELVAPPAGPEGWTFGRWVKGQLLLAPRGCLDYALVAGGERRQWNVAETYEVHAGGARGKLGGPLSDHKLVRFECCFEVPVGGDRRYVEKTRFDSWGAVEQEALERAMLLHTRRR